MGGRSLGELLRELAPQVLGVLVRRYGLNVPVLLLDGTVVCKPLDGMGGRSIFVLPPGDKNQRVVFETLTGYGQRYAITQTYLPEIAVSVIA